MFIVDTHRNAHKPFFVFSLTDFIIFLRAFQKAEEGTHTHTHREKERERDIRRERKTYGERDTHGERDIRRE
jgi:hypothetical protein